jgi:hypothetical protein
MLTTSTLLAAALDVGVNALYCTDVFSPSIQCGIEGCQYPALRRNGQAGQNAGPRCAVHRQSWYPSKLQRGNLLLGTEFLRSDVKSLKKSCMCMNKTCHGIGYSPTYINVPRQASIRQNVFQALASGYHASSDEKRILKERLLNDSKKDLFLAPWHFWPEHREGHFSFRRSIKKDFAWRDPEGRMWTDFPPPNYAPQNFINNEFPPSRIHPRGRFVSSLMPDLPSWVQAYVKVEKDLERKAIAATLTPVVPAYSLRSALHPYPAVISAVVSFDLSPAATSNNQKTDSRQSNSNPPTENTTKTTADTTKTTTVNLNRYLDLNTENKVLEEDLDFLRLSFQKKIDELKVASDAKDKMLLQMKTELVQIRNENNSLKREKEEQQKKMQSVMTELTEKVERLTDENSACQAQLSELSESISLSFSDLRPEGRLDRQSQQYTFFSTYQLNNAFLDALNFIPGVDCEIEGLLVRLRRYRGVSRQERCGETERPAGKKRMRSRKLDWRTEYFLFSMYCRVDITQRQLAPLFGVKTSTVSDVIYAWANALEQSLSHMFPTPTRSQLLSAYPIRFIKKWGDARISLLLDATELWTQTAGNTNVGALLYSSYKGHDTMKLLAGCDPIGCLSDGSVPDKVYGGSIGDVMATDDTKIIYTVPFGSKIQVDKGFLIDNMCARAGVGCVRPVKKQRNQTQTSEADTAETQKIGNTRIVIEQCNGGAKQQGSYFNGVIPLTQLGLAPSIMKVCFLMQNFKPAYIHGYDHSRKVNGGRPCRGEVRWFGASDNGLIDVRGQVDKWGTQKEIQRFLELQNMEENKNKTTIHIGQMVLDEDWPTKERAELERYIHGDTT